MPGSSDIIAHLNCTVGHVTHEDTYCSHCRSMSWGTAGTSYGSKTSLCNLHTAEHEECKYLHSILCKSSYMIILTWTLIQARKDRIWVHFKDMVEVKDSNRG